MILDYTKSRDDAYKWILHFGLIRLRNLSRECEFNLAEIEADHLHNVPTYIGSQNEADHQYYLTKEVELYLERLTKSATAQEEDARFWYTGAWEILRSTER